MKVKYEIDARLAYLGWTKEELAIKSHMSLSTLNRRLADISDLRLGEQHLIEKALGWKYGSIGRMEL